MGRTVSINWDEIKVYFVTQTSSINETDSLRSVAKKFNISAAALSRKAGSPDDNGKTWYDYRNKFLERSLIETGTKKINNVVENIKSSKQMLKLLKSGATKQLMEVLGDERKRKEFFETMSVKTMLEIIKLDTDIDLKLIEIFKQGLTDSERKLILSINKDPKNMTVEELEEFEEKVKTFNFDEAEFTVVNSEK